MTPHDHHRNPHPVYTGLSRVAKSGWHFENHCRCKCLSRGLTRVKDGGCPRPICAAAHTVPGKRGLNAFSNTDLNDELRARGIENVVLAGAVTSICIDSTGRAAHERNFNVTVLADVTASRTPFEQSFYCENVFPLYANVCTSDEFCTVN